MLRQAFGEAVSGRAEVIPEMMATPARLKPDVSVTQAQAEMSRIETVVAGPNPGIDLKDGIRVGSTIDSVIGLPTSGTRKARKRHRPFMCLCSTRSGAFRAYRERVQPRACR